MALPADPEHYDWSGQHIAGFEILLATAARSRDFDYALGTDADDEPGSLIADVLPGLHDLVAVVHIVQDILPQTMAQAQGHHLGDVLFRDLRSPIEGTEGAGGPVRHDVATKAVDI